MCQGCAYAEAEFRDSAVILPIARVGTEVAKGCFRVPSALGHAQGECTTMMTPSDFHAASNHARARLGLAMLTLGLCLATYNATSFASPKPVFGRFHEGAPGEGPLTPRHKAEIQACFDEAREQNPRLVVRTTATLEAESSGRVISASVPVPDSPSFQQCVEAQALTWSFPPPPDASLPPPPPGARLHVMFPIQLPD
jgi:hypothetical protein